MRYANNFRECHSIYVKIDIHFIRIYRTNMEAFYLFIKTL